MRFASLTLIVLLGLCGNAHGQRACDQVEGFKHLVATGPVELVAAKEGQRIYFCGFTISQKGTTLDLLIMLGKGTNCGIDTVDVDAIVGIPK